VTKDEAANFKITFGKYRSRKFGEVYAEDPKWVAWCYGNLSKIFCAEFMEACEAFGIDDEDLQK
jgi:hypothetical protein